MALLTRHNNEGHLDSLDLGPWDEAPGAGPPAVLALQSDLPAPGLSEGDWNE